MRYTPLDLFMMRIRGLIALLCLFALPVMLFSYAWGLKLLLQHLDSPAWAVVIVVSHVIAWVGLASLLDSLSGHRPPPASDRHNGPAPR